MKILLTGNLAFIPLAMDNTFCKGSRKYMAADINGGVMPSEIYTEDEIRASYPDLKEAKGFVDIKRVYYE